MAAFGSDLRREHTALMQAVGLIPLGQRTQIELAGEDRAKFLHNLCTQEIRKLTPGSGAEALLLDAKGHVQFFVNVFCREQSLLLETTAGENQRLLAHLDRYLIRDDVVITDRTPQWSELLLAGPRAVDLLPGAPSELFGNLDLTVAALNGITLQVRRVDWLHSDGLLLAGPVAEMDAVASLLQSQGAKLCSLQTLEIARVEAGTPVHGRDITDKTLPQELNRDARCISFVKGCYIGQETVARIDALGHVNKLLCGLKFSSDTVPQQGQDLTVDDTVVGQVTSAVFSPRLEAPLAMAYIKRAQASPGTELQSTVGPARVITLPLA